MAEDITISPSEEFAQAVALHRAGKLEEAKARYQALLSLQPGAADVIHLLGLVNFQLKDYAAAEPLLRQAIALQGRAADFHFNLGAMLLEQGRHQEAEEAFRQASMLKPYDGEILNNLAVSLASQRRHGEAEAVLRQALKLLPDDAELHFNLANTLRALGRGAEAEAHFRRTLALQGDYGAAWVSLGDWLLSQNRLDEAETCFRRALEAIPGMAEGRNGLAAVLRNRNCLGEAESELRNLLAEKPDYAEGWNNLGVVLNDAWRLEEAESCFRRALELRPEYAIAWNGLGSVLMDAQRTEEAKSAYLAAIAAEPDYPHAHWNLGILFLTLGDFARGWPEYEQRLRRTEVSHLYAGYAAPLWQGEDLHGKTILLHAEQGLGDTLQFIRFAPEVARRAERVVVECQPGLKRLLTTVGGVAGVYAKGEALPPHDVRCPMMSLPYRLGVNAVADIPAHIPYLAAEPSAVDAWREKLQPLPGLKVGLVWAGDPRKFDPESHRIDQRRSLSLEAFEPLFGLSGVSYISLQKGEASAQVRAYEGRVLDWMGEIGDFADTAALVSCLDLVIAVDTSVAHLAGALGKEVWLLSRFDGCWRWMLGRSDSPWYPTMTLFRQPKPGRWDSVVAEIGNALAARLSGNG
ncbi:MAG: tetratricopeptide repeat protein [Sulfuricellaceae bacterium]|jgi:tetratricopeptide (TPR) repeat protein